MIPPSRLDSVDITPVGYSLPGATLPALEPTTSRWVLHLHFERSADLQKTSLLLSQPLPATLRSFVVVLHPRGNPSPEAFEPSMSTIGLVHAIVRAFWTPLNNGTARGFVVGLEGVGEFFQDAEHRYAVVSLGVTAEAAEINGSESTDREAVRLAPVPKGLGEGVQDGDTVPLAMLALRAPSFDEWKKGLPPAAAAREAVPPA